MTLHRCLGLRDRRLQTSPPDLAFWISRCRADGMELPAAAARPETDMRLIFLNSKEDEEIDDELFGLKMGARRFIRKRLAALTGRARGNRCCARWLQKEQTERTRRHRPQGRCDDAASFAWTQSATPAPGRTSR